jgi:integrase/recombinase XerD
MSTREVVDAYLASRRALGVRLERCGRRLRQFVRETDNAALADIGPEIIDQFLRGRALSTSWTSKYHALAGLYRFAIARGYVAVSPLPTHRPKLPPQQTPYIYSTDELQRLIDATAVLHSRRSTSQAATYRTFLLLLYGTGCA